MFVGLSQLNQVKVDVIPEFSPPYVEVQTEALGLSAEEVEQLITVPLEADLLNGVAWLKTIRSSSIPGLSSIVLIFESGTDLIRARQMVQERLTLSHGIPQVSKPPVMLQPLSSTSRVMQVGLTSKDLKKLSHIDMSVLARWTIKPRLMGVPGVAHVSIWGQRKRQLQVQVDPEELKAKGVTLNEIIKTTGESLWVSPLTFLEASTPGTGGWIDTPNQRLGVRHISPINSPDQLSKVAVHGKSMPLSDVAKVVEDHQQLIGDSIINNEPGLLLVIEKFPWANTLDVTRGVEKALASLSPGLSGMTVDSKIFRPATFVETAVSNVKNVLLISVLLIIIALFGLLYNWRMALISLISIPLSLLSAVFVLYLRGITVDSMVFAGLMVALAAVIDEAIIDVENIRRKLRHYRDQGSDKPTLSIMVEGALEMRSSMVYATLVVALAVIPVYFMQDLLGALLQPMVMSFLLALLASMVVAFTVTPALTIMLLGNSSFGSGRSPIMTWLNKLYETFVLQTARPMAAIFTAVAVAVIGLFSWTQLSQSLLPAFKENTLMVKLDGPPGTSRLAMYGVVAKAGQELRSLPGVENVSAHVGRAVMSDEIVNVNSSQLWVSLDPSADHDATVADIERVIANYPGLDGDVLTYVQAKLEAARPEAGEDLAVRVYGSNPEVLRAKADEVKTALASIRGVSNPRIEGPRMEPTLEIKVDLAKAKKYGIKPGDVRRAATTLLSGIQVGSLFEEQKVFDVVVWGKPETRQNLTNVKNLLLDTPRGDHVRLQEVADVGIVPAQTVIKREAVARHIDIDANVEGRDLSSVIADIDRSIKAISFPLEHHAEILGSHAERLATLRRVRDFAIAAAIGIFLLLQAAFRSWRLAAIVFVTLPTSLAGGLLAAFVTGGVLSLGSIAGLTAVFAIAACNAIAMIRHVQHLEAEEGEAFSSDLVVRGLKDRFQPIASTAITAGLALLPFALFGQAGHEVVQPMAIVFLGGLVTSTILNLYVLPKLIMSFGQSVSDEKPILGVS